MDRFRFALAQLRGDLRRSVASGLSILVAVTSFVVLTGNVQSQQLKVTGQVAENYRSTYDILVRPAGSVSAIERDDQLVRPNFLSGSETGITANQVAQIAALPGVQVAAPVAVAGQVVRNVPMRIKLDTAALLAGRDHVMLRYRVNTHARAATASSSEQHGYLYLSKKAIRSVDNKDGTSRFRQHVGSGDVDVCYSTDRWPVPARPSQTMAEYCWSAVTDGQDATPAVETSLHIPLTLAAVDPNAEAALTGLDRAVVKGRILQPGDASSVVNPAGGGPAVDGVTAMMATALPFDFQATVVVDELGSDVTDRVLHASPKQRGGSDQPGSSGPVRGHNPPRRRPRLCRQPRHHP